MVKVVGIAGSLRPESHSHQALKLATDRVKILGASVEILDLRQMQLPFCNGGEDYPTGSPGCVTCSIGQSKSAS